MKYERHIREYTVVGVSACWEAIMSDKFRDYVGITFEEVLTVIKNGDYYHFQRVGDRERTSKTFLIERYKTGEVDLEKDTKEFVTDLKNYYELLETDKSDLDQDIILRFYKYYEDLVILAYLTIDPPDYLDVLEDEKLEKRFMDWAVETRKQAENIYKWGESKFVPRFLEWLTETELPDYTPEQLSYLYHRELRDYLEHKKALPSIEVLEKRFKCYYLSQLPGRKYKDLAGKDAENVIDENKLFEDEIDLDGVDEVKGQTAFSGKVAGKVRIVIKKADLSKFNPGEILVTPMTDPSYLPVMKQAVGFVTDEGGTLSHAAIVARELEKPCIIGTKIATKVFKDGDKVEVDAERGVVRKIEK